MNDYEKVAEVLASIQHFIEAVYDRKRLHSVIGYLSFAAACNLQKPLCL
jgi:hypothetical protein